MHLVARLSAGDYRLLDTQFTTKHLKQFGAIDMDRRRYHRLLEDAIARHADFNALPRQATGDKEPCGRLRRRSGTRRVRRVRKGWPRS